MGSRKEGPGLAALRVADQVHRCTEQALASVIQQVVRWAKRTIKEAKSSTTVSVLLAT
jgi:hypothetical protein